MDLENRQISVLKAEQLANALSGKGAPSPGRILICTPKGEQKTASGIIIPGSGEKELPRKGVVIQVNNLELLDPHVVKVGTIITYGMYAGKEIEFSANLIPKETSENYKFTILSETEVIYIETNQ